MKILGVAKFFKKSAMQGNFPANSGGRASFTTDRKKEHNYSH